jgi:hypothetical protein
LELEGQEVLAKLVKQQAVEILRLAQLLLTVVVAVAAVLLFPVLLTPAIPELVVVLVEEEFLQQAVLEIHLLLAQVKEEMEEQVPRLARVMEVEAEAALVLMVEMEHQPTAAMVETARLLA